MLTKLFEWYRIAEISPTDETLERRKLAIADVITGLKNGESEIIASAATACATGFELGFNQTSPLVILLTDSIRKHHPASPGELQETRMQLRACLCIAVGEILNRATSGVVDSNSELIALFLISALESRPQPRERYLKDAISELKSLAYGVSENSASNTHRVTKASPLPASKLELADEQPPSVAKFSKELYEYIKKIAQASRAANESLAKRIDVLSEELNLLWWLYSGLTSDTREPIGELASNRAALHAAKEISRLAIVPSFHSTRQLVRRAVSENRKSTQLGKKQLENFVGDWQLEDIAAAVATDEAANPYIAKYPAVFPVLWICSRIHESGITTGWSEEFNRKTGISPKLELGTPEWSVQLFNEFAGKRLLASNI